MPHTVFGNKTSEIGTKSPDLGIWPLQQILLGFDLLWGFDGVGPDRKVARYRHTVPGRERSTVSGSFLLVHRTVNVGRYETLGIHCWVKRYWVPDSSPPSLYPPRPVVKVESRPFPPTGSGPSLFDPGFVVQEGDRSDS